MEKHGGEEVKWEMRVLANFNRDALGRQSVEAILIREADLDFWLPCSPISPHVRP